MADANKDTIYVDVDDEITGIIDKVRSSKHRIIALVLPKRATMFQSIVNMKLLKRSADSSKKQVVLITAEAGLLPLAGAVGLPVARTLQSKPVIPSRPETAANALDDDSVIDDDDVPAPLPVAAGAAVPASAVAEAADETIELDGDEDSPTDAITGAAATKPIKGKNKKLKVPDFNKFRLLLVLGGVILVALIVFGYFATKVMPKAAVTISTNSTDVNTRLNLTLSTKQNALDTAKLIVPATAKTSKKTQTQQVSASGQQNNGQKAHGQIKLVNCTSGDEVTVPAGTGVTANGQTFITEDDANMPIGSKTCKDIPGVSSATVDVTAIKPGTVYNIAPATFTVSGYSSVKGSSSGNMGGGTDDIVKIVQQADIDSAKTKLSSDEATASFKDSLQDDLTRDGLYPIAGTFNTGTPLQTSNVNAGVQADAVTVTQTVTYTMLGVSKADLTTLITNNVKSQIDTKKQQILNDGVSKANFTINDADDINNMQVTIATTSLAGPDIHTDDIKKQIAGQKAGAVKSTIKALPGVTNVEVKYSPFWVTAVPSNVNKVTVTLEKST